MRRVLSVVALCALPLSVVTFAFAGTASAASSATSQVSCSKLTGNITGTTGSISKCTGSVNIGGSGTFPIAALTGGSGTITWKTKGSTPVTVTASANGGTACGANTEYAVTGTTGKSTGSAKKIKSGSAISALACVNGTTGAFTLVKKTDFTIA